MNSIKVASNSFCISSVKKIINIYMKRKTYQVTDAIQSVIRFSFGGDIPQFARLLQRRRRLCRSMLKGWRWLLVFTNTSTTSHVIRTRLILLLFQFAVLRQIVLCKVPKLLEHAGQVLRHHLDSSLTTLSTKFKHT